MQTFTLYLEDAPKNRPQPPVCVNKNHVTSVWQLEGEPTRIRLIDGSIVPVREKFEYVMSKLDPQWNSTPALANADRSHDRSL